KAEPPGLYLLSTGFRGLLNSCTQLVTGSDIAERRWTVSYKSSLAVEQLLPGGRWLVSEAVNAKRGSNPIAAVGERDPAGRKSWTFTLAEGEPSLGIYPRVCRRVGGMYTVVANWHFDMLLDNRGSIVWKNEHETKHLVRSAGVDPAMAARPGSYGES